MKTLLTLAIIGATLASLYYLIPAAWDAFNRWFDRSVDRAVAAIRADEGRRS